MQRRIEFLHKVERAIHVANLRCVPAIDRKRMGAAGPLDAFLDEVLESVARNTNLGTIGRTGGSAVDFALECADQLLAPVVTIAIVGEVP
ncbi:unnamed protein product [Pseudo-nitzschia multistriata]|uniref:Uncharacterized protein n=1 Tax=Pseudo-nitzschia multistriata TaxID=183589 RepID=A0A448ZED4_9STRA|nr:unnamed protein product [Pseudo-nitzschia multistriata]